MQILQTRGPLRRFRAGIKNEACQVGNASFETPCRLADASFKYSSAVESIGNHFNAQRLLSNTLTIRAETRTLETASCYG